MRKIRALKYRERSERQRESKMLAEDSRDPDDEPSKPKDLSRLGLKQKLQMPEIGGLGKRNGGPRPPGMPQTPLKSDRPRMSAQHRVQEEIKVSERQVPMSEVQSKHYDHPKLRNNDHYQ